MIRFSGGKRHLQPMLDGSIIATTMITFQLLYLIQFLIIAAFVVSLFAHG